MGDRPDDSLTLRELVAQTTSTIGSRHEARWLCEVAVALDGADFDSALDEPVAVKMVAHLDQMIARYRNGEPLAYVLGRWSFRHLDVAVDRRVLIPRPETELVAGVAIDLARSFPAPRRVVDLGTGSGVIGLSLAAELPVVGTEVWVTDASDDAIAVARANLAGIGRAAANVRIGTGSWFEAVPDELDFQVVVSNPPYVADASPDLADDVLAWEPRGALFAGQDGLRDIGAIVTASVGRLAAGGWLVLEIGADQGPSVRGLLMEHGYQDIEVRTDLAGRDRIAVARHTRSTPQ